MKGSVFAQKKTFTMACIAKTFTLTYAGKIRFTAGESLIVEEIDNHTLNVKDMVFFTTGRKVKVKIESVASGIIQSGLSVVYLRISIEVLEARKALASESVGNVCRRLVLANKQKLIAFRNQLEDLEAADLFTITTLSETDLSAGDMFRLNFTDLLSPCVTSNLTFTAGIMVKIRSLGMIEISLVNGTKLKQFSLSR